MEEPEWERGEQSERAARDAPKQPFGLQVAILFVRCTVALVVLLTAGMMVATLAILVSEPRSNESIRESLVASVVMLTASVLLLAIVAGGCLLDANLSGRAFWWLGQKGGHPVRQIILSLVGVVVGYGALAMLVWLLRVMNKDYDAITTVVWGIIGIAVFFLYRHLNKVQPP